MNFAKLIAKIDSIESKQTLNEGWADMMKASKEKSEKDTKDKGTGKFDKKETGTGTVYTRKSSTFDDGGEDKDVKKAKEKAKDKKKVGESSMADLIKAMDAIVESERKVDEEEVEEGPEIFKLKADAAKKAGQKEFKGPDGKMHPVKESEEKDDNKKPDEDGDGVPDWADKKSGKDDKDEDKKDNDKDEDKKDEVDEGIEDRLANLDMNNPINQPAYQRKRNAQGGVVPVATPASNDTRAIPKPTKPKTGSNVVPIKSLEESFDQAMAGGEDSGMNISSNMDTNSGSKSLTVSARGESAEELAQILKLSGLIGQGAHNEPHAIEVEMAEAEYANEPAPMVQGIDAQLRQGNDLNRPKGTHPKVAGGDNPMQAVRPMQTIRIAEDRELQILESRLARELESIKIKK